MVENIRPWPDSQLDIGECKDCKSTISYPRPADKPGLLGPLADGVELVTSMEEAEAMYGKGSQTVQDIRNCGAFEPRIGLTEAATLDIEQIQARSTQRRLRHIERRIEDIGTTLVRLHALPDSWAIARRIRATRALIEALEAEHSEVSSGVVA